MRATLRQILACTPRGIIATKRLTAARHALSGMIEWGEGSPTARTGTGKPVWLATARNPLTTCIYQVFTPPQPAGGLPPSR